MFGISYGELFLLIGATAALVGPKDLPKIARAAGRLAGRSIGYVQLARGQFDNVMQQSQARQVHKDLQDTMAQLDAIRHEIRSLSLVNPGPMTRRLMENPPEPASDSNVTVPPEKREEEKNSTDTVKKDFNSMSSAATDLHSQATAYARLAESEALKAGSVRSERRCKRIRPCAGSSSGSRGGTQCQGLLFSASESNTVDKKVSFQVTEACDRLSLRIKVSSASTMWHQPWVFEHKHILLGSISL
ncbi:hypothetical protein V6N12_027942 [Hibiscus sabdariffa]|uniref:Sec-independent protein translocase protein TatB n=1 Tax=Hibiscus sabdariffa TaxID=183260 RepID=A0ABR2F4G1_9ROSI